MLKIIFWLLLLANATLFAMQKGYLGALYSDGREPTRISKQLQADKIKMTVAEAAQAASAAVASTAPAAPAAAADPAPVVACTEIGNFAAAEARRFSSKLAERAPNVKFVRRETQEVASHMVYLPSLGSKDAADKKADEIRRLGISDFFVIQDSGALRYGISLGIFRTDEAAQKQVASLAKRGLGGAKISTRTVSSSKVAFQLRDLGGDAKIAFDKIKLDFPGQEVRSCAGP
ncbi:Sporulation related domain-containing protein [Collimonas sp. OK607]|uniref:SPOR domain-containing protein n=1 Tax=Collimonas sp. OK607 TaxID=1798194 RepID=UPI0008E8287E|nr:SPOR domain-containing protein [Collimonas sp. OK607]SFB29994.1 Sporulation related domain-containing protein [Collimonas sp. OK607]